MKSERGVVDHARLQSALIVGAPRLRQYLEAKIPTRLRSIISADDLLQDVWIAAFRGLASFRPEGKDAIDRWITSIAHNKLLNSIKAATAAKRGGGRVILRDHADFVSSMLDLFAQVASDRRTPSSEAAVAEAVDAIQVALTSLPTERRRAIWLRYVQGRSGEEIAVAMRKTKPAVNSLLYHGLRQLREHLGSAARFLSDVRSSEDAPAT